METTTKNECIQFLNELRRSDEDVWLAGVCGGLAEHSGVPTWCFRALFVSTAIFFWLGLIAYIALWIFMPIEDGAESQVSNSEVGGVSHPHAPPQ